MGTAIDGNLNLSGWSKVSSPDLGLASPKKRMRQSWILQNGVIPRSLIYGSVLFALGLISLFTGNVVSEIEWSKFRRYRRGATHYDIDIWKSDFAKLYYGCSDRSPKFGPAVPQNQSNGYLLIATSGGLNQQRTGITDAVVVARILNATLVIPELDHNSFWKDESDFANIFDVNWFISSLAKDVIVVRRVPDKVMRSMEKPPYSMRVPRRSTPEYYLDQVLPILLRRNVVQLTKFDYRLTNELDDNLQKLRCFVNFHALRFTKPIRVLGQKLVKKMRKMSSRFIAVHLRFEPDMLAFSGCYFGGGQKERNELSKIRERWETLPDLDAENERSRGEIYGGERTLQPLRDYFPNFYTKEILAGEDLKPFLSFSSRLAAIDYIVCEDSDVFVTNNNGNMAKILAGRSFCRRFAGHKRTIRPNAKKLSPLFKAQHKMEWATFAKKVKLYQRSFMGEPEEMKPGRGDFHEYPYSCICQKPDMQQTELGGRPAMLKNSSRAVEGLPLVAEARRFIRK
ncbi:uncharacterized protein At1g04910-like isoform X3 [Phalaenopsis equestris]|uniref:uncharacterized protein At1g04910-like isoform X3 n=1 Tax=Phalaenopsis equestris TaxID=78828 RepID=UPI0009E3C79C|nr:uncharacterized protein At1g04910-like isoform X3 [Phalaenopsis equestris]